MSDEQQPPEMQHNGIVEVPEVLPANPSKPDALLRELAWMALTGRGDIWGDPYVPRDEAIAILFGSTNTNPKLEGGE